MVEVPVVVGEEVLAVDEGVFDGDALGEDHGAVVGVGVRGGVSHTSGVGAYGGVPMILTVARVLLVNDECRLLGDCCRHEDDVAHAFAEFLGGVDEFVVALYAAFGVVCSARVVDGLEMVGAFVDVAAGVVRTLEEDNLGRGTVWGEGR